MFLLKFHNPNTFTICHNLASVQSVRWARKPRWLPVAPSKVFKVPQRFDLPHEEESEWQRLNNNYRTQVNSLRRYLIQEVGDKRTFLELHATPADEEAEFQRCLAINEVWNNDIAQMRDIRILEENENRREQILMSLDNKKVRDELVRNEIEQKVKQEEEASKHFITQANIDQAIEHALANPVSFEYSIDLQGTKKGDSIKEQQLQDEINKSPEI